MSCPRLILVCVESADFRLELHNSQFLQKGDHARADQHVVLDQHGCEHRDHAHNDWGCTAGIDVLAHASGNDARVVRSVQFEKGMG